MRGRVARAHKNIVANLIIRKMLKILGVNIFPINSVVVINLINRILAYSAIKIRANSPALYSILNPDTSSDSPSARSKGERFVSARLVINHINKIGLANMSCGIIIWLVIRCMSINLRDSRINSKIRAIVTSYEIVCAILRSAPRSAYFELAHHPEMKVVYTFMLEIHKKYRMPNVINIPVDLWG